MDATRFLCWLGVTGLKKNGLKDCPTRLFWVEKWGFAEFGGFLIFIHYVVSPFILPFSLPIAGWQLVIGAIFHTSRRTSRILARA